MKFNKLPLNMQEDINKLIRRYPIAKSEVTRLYLMGGNYHSEYLCQLKSGGMSEVIIQAVNNKLWDKINKKGWRYL